MSKDLKIVKCSEADCMRAIKEFLNLVVNDKKRFPILKNKFKKSIDTISIQDGFINKIEFHNIDHKTMLEELNSAIESGRGYLERSEKKKNQLEKIVKLDFSVDTPVKEEKTKTSKVTKDKPTPVKEEKPKEVKKVKNKNEEKAAKIKEDNAKAQNPEDLAIRNYVRSLSEKEVEKLVEDIKDAFKNDSRISVTMANFVKNNSSLDDAAIAMLNSAYSRKPNNKAMAPIYFKFTIKLNKKEASKPVKKEASKAKGPVVKGLPKETKKTTKATDKAIKETKSNKDVAPKPEKSVKKIKKEFYLWTSIINGKNLKDEAKKVSFNVESEKTKSFFAPSLKTIVSVDIKTTTTDPKLEIVNTYLDYYNSKVQDETSKMNHEAYLLGLGIVNCFNNSVTKNFIAMCFYSLGIEHKERKEIITIFGNGLSSGPLNLENTLNNYNEDTKEFSQIANYKYNRELIMNILNVATDSVKVLMFDFIGEYLVATVQKLFLDKSLVPGKNTDLFSITYYSEADGEKNPENTEPTNDTIRYTITASAISFVFKNTSFNIQKTDENYSKIHEAIIANDSVRLNDLVQTKDKIVENLTTIINSKDSIMGDLIGGEEIKIVDKTVVCGKRIFKGAVSVEFIKYIAENNVNKVNAIKNFIWNASQNPSEQSVAELYDFAVKNKLKITPSGTVLLYKWVQDNYLDTHSRTFLNEPGVTVRMDRSKVNANRSQTCSNGLHLCSWKYGSFGSRLLLCELNPKNSVSIPEDYNNSKMRCCEYTVLMDITEYHSIMSSKGDYLSKVEDIHFNTKLLELNIMKMYPEIVRTNSRNGLNGLSGGSPDLLKTFGEIVNNIQVAPTVVDVEEDSEKEECQVQNNQENNDKVVMGIDITEGNDQSIGDNDIEPIDNQPTSEIPESPIINHDGGNSKDDVETEEESAEKLAIKNANYIKNSYADIMESIVRLIEKNVVPHYLMDDILFDHIIENPDIYKMDQIIVSTIKEVYNNKITDKTSFWSMFRKLTLEQISSCHITEEEFSESKEHAPAQEVKHDDGVKVVDTPNKTNETLVSKVGGFFKKFF